MRLIGTLETEQQAYSFYSFLLKEKIQNTYEAFSEENANAKHYRIWVYDEDDLQAASEWLDLYKKSPQDPRFAGADLPVSSSPPPAAPKYSEISKSEDLKWQSVPPVIVKRRRLPLTLTNLIILLCSILFIANDFQEAQIAKEKGTLAAQIAMTPLEKNLFFDYPSSYRYIEELIETVPLNSYQEMKNLPPEAVTLLKKAENAPSWNGLYAFYRIGKEKGWKEARSVPLFEKIRQGELWRLFTPCLMHANFLHILFNMAWVWILVGQVEARMRKWKLCLLMLIIGVVSNVVQYLVGGPFFLGYSGIIVGLACFIWMRQKKAPWEGYPLQKSTLLFLLIFVLAMFAIELFTFGLQMFSTIQIHAQIANTAHIVGGLVGLALGRLSFFKRSAA